MVRRIRDLASATHLLASGKFDTRVSGDSSDELGQLSRDFNTLALTLEKNEAARRQWVADISHELRTPLSVLRGEIEAFQDGVREATPQAIGALHGEVMKLGRLVEDLYELSLSDLGALTYRRTDTDLGRPPAAGDRPVPARVRRAGDPPRSRRAARSGRSPLFADPDRLNQLFSNLLENSLKYTDGGGRLKVRIEREERTAVGAFRGFRARRSRVRASPPLRPALQGGRFPQPRDRRGGTRPRDLPEHRRGPQWYNRCLPLVDGGPLGEAGTSLERIGGKMPGKIFVVEDEPRLASLLADYLRQAGYEPHCIGDGREVVARVREQAPDLVLLDLMLPGKDGIEICKEIRAFSSLPIVMVTARVEEIDRLLGLELGADDYICKPFSPREVVARVKAVLRRAGGRREPRTRG